MYVKHLRAAESRKAGIPVSILARDSLANAFLVSVLLREPSFRLLPPRPSTRGGHDRERAVFVLPLEPSLAAAEARLFALRRSFPRAKFLLAGKPPTADQIPSLLRLGAEGFVAADKIESELAAAIKEIWLGHVWIRLEDMAARGAGGHLREAPHDSAGGDLTDRESRTAELVRRGLSNKQIAAEMGITERTVKFHLRNVFLKFGVTDRHALAAALATQHEPRSAPPLSR